MSWCLDALDLAILQHCGTHSCGYSSLFAEGFGFYYYTPKKNVDLYTSESLNTCHMHSSKVVSTYIPCCRELPFAV